MNGRLTDVTVWNWTGRSEKSDDEGRGSHASTFICISQVAAGVGSGIRPGVAVEPRLPGCGSGERRRVEPRARIGTERRVGICLPHRDPTPYGRARGCDPPLCGTAAENSALAEGRIPCDGGR